MNNLFGEFLGTLVLCAFGNGICACCLLNKSKGQNAGWLMINIGWGIAVTMGVFTAIACGAPQADINPAVTLTKLMGGVYTLPHALITMSVQIAGGFCGAVVAWLCYLGHWEATDDKGIKLGVFATGPAIRNTPANLITEIIGTMALIVLIMVIFSVPVGGSAGLVSGFGPFLVGFLVLAIGTAFGGPTGYAINPARDLGPRIAHAVLPIAGKGGSDWGYSWIPIVGPFIGAGLSYAIVKAIGVAFVG
ncbi:aquaporin family protein [Dethiosulfovibrio sp. F2B]|uniref:MIP/aquaporin family protein n=1 Tax=Dethiosulfovibrio faecalis TaxID=2720018 RepID=UPI001F2056CF|nr:aquaporin family protein [Dethiosulfovibrio faecalis]